MRGSPSAFPEHECSTLTTGVVQSQTNRPQGASEMQLVAAVAQATRAAAEAATAAAGAAGIWIYDDSDMVFERPKASANRRSRRRQAPRRQDVMSGSDDQDAPRT